MSPEARWSDAFPRETFSVRCRGELHGVTWQPGHSLVFHDHADLDADRALVVLGGEAVGCADLAAAVAHFQGGGRLLELWRPLERNPDVWRVVPLRETATGVIPPTIDELRASLADLQVVLKRVDQGKATVGGVRGPPPTEAFRRQVDEMAMLIAMPVGLLNRLAVDRLQDAVAAVRHPERKAVPHVAEVWGMEGLRRTVPVPAHEDPGARRLNVRFAATEPSAVVGHVDNSVAHAALWVGEQWLREVLVRDAVVAGGRLVLDLVSDAGGGAIAKLVEWRRPRGTPAGTLEPVVVEASMARGVDGRWQVTTDV